MNFKKYFIENTNENLVPFNIWDLDAACSAILISFNYLSEKYINSLTPVMPTIVETINSLFDSAKIIYNKKDNKSKTAQVSRPSLVLLKSKFLVLQNLIEKITQENTADFKNYYFQLDSACYNMISDINEALRKF